MITKFKLFEDIRDEFPGMFEPRKVEDEPQIVPGFEGGTIDPNDDEEWNIGGKKYKTGKESYIDFLKTTKERNFKESDKFIQINIKKLYHDFIMSIYNPKNHFTKLIDDELINKYIVNSISDYDGGIYNGIVTDINYIFNGNSVFLEITLKDQKLPNLVYNENIITIDKVKSSANKYNL